MTSPHPILQEAFELITGTRAEQHGDASKMFARHAKLWSVVLGHEVTPAQVALCMIATKLAREAHRPDYDNRLDLIGYAALLEHVTKSPVQSAEVREKLRSMAGVEPPPFAHPDLEPQGLPGPLSTRTSE